jgi:hypothetical protein
MQNARTVGRVCAVEKQGESIIGGGKVYLNASGNNT